MKREWSVSKKICLLVLTTIMLLSTSGLSACLRNADSARIVEAVVDFWDAYDKSEFMVCLDYLSDRLRAEEGDDNLLARLAATRKLNGGVTIKDIGQPVLVGPTATIQVDTVFDNIGLRPTKHALIKKGRNWRINEY